MSRPARLAVTIAASVSRQQWIVVAICGLVLAAIVVTQPHEVFWGPDSGNRFIQLQTLLRGGGIEVGYPARDLDPELRFFPTGGHHFLKRADSAISFYSPAAALLSLPFFRLFGSAGLLLLPLVAGLALAWLTPRLRPDGATGSVPAIPLLLFATPIAFYSVVFWEHTPAALLIALAVLAALHRPQSTFAWLGAGAAIGLAAALREESYPIAAAFVFAAMIAGASRRNLAALTGGLLAVMLPLWIVNQWLYGSPLGLHGSVYGEFTSEATLLTQLSEKASNFFVYLFEAIPQRILNYVLIAPHIAFLAVALLRSSETVRRVRVALVLAVGVSSAIFAAMTWSAGEPLRRTLFAQGLFSTVPIALLAVGELRDELRTSRAFRFALSLCGASIVLITLLLNQRDVGLIWGPRHYLALMAPLVALALRFLFRLHEHSARLERRLLVAASIMIVASSVTLQIAGIRTLRQKLHFSEKLVTALRQSPSEVIATDVFWAPEDVAALWYERRVVFVSSDRDFYALLNRLRASGVKRMTFIAGRRDRQLSQRALSLLLQGTTQRTRIDGGEPSMDVMLLHYELR